MPATLPPPAVAAIAIVGVLTSLSLPADIAAQIASTSEPVRFVGALLFGSAADGGDWWDAVADLVG